MSSARAAGSIAGGGEQRRGSAPSERRLWRSILRRWPNAAAVMRSSVVRVQGRGLARGTSRTTDEVTLGGGTKAEGATSNMIFASVRQPASTARRPNGLSPGLATMRSATSRWNISTIMSNHGGHGSVPSQRTSSAVEML